jgi:preprotein translocase subunit SecE
VNRQYKRMMEKQQGRDRRPVRPQPRQPGAPVRKKRTSPRQFLREVAAELRKVTWPSRQEVIAYSWVVLIGVVAIGAVIFVMDYVFAKGVYALFGIES